MNDSCPYLTVRKLYQTIREYLEGIRQNIGSQEDIDPSIDLAMLNLYKHEIRIIGDVRLFANDTSYRIIILIPNFFQLCPASKLLNELREAAAAASNVSYGFGKHTCGEVHVEWLYYIPNITK